MQEGGTEGGDAYGLKHDDSEWLFVIIVTVSDGQCLVFGLMMSFIDHDIKKRAVLSSSKCQFSRR